MSRPMIDQKKGGKQHRTYGNATDNLSRTASDRLLILGFRPCTQQSFRLVILSASCQYERSAYGPSVADSVYVRWIVRLRYNLFSAGPRHAVSHAERIRRIIRFNHRISCKFEGGLYLDSRIFLWGDEHFTQTTEKTLLFEGSVTTVSRCVITRCCTRCWVTTESCWAIIFFNLTGGYHAVIRLTQRPQHSYRICILLAYRRLSTLSVHCTSRSSVQNRFSISRCTKRTRKKTIPPATKCSLRQSFIWWSDRKPEAINILNHESLNGRRSLVL